MPQLRYEIIPFPKALKNGLILIEGVHVTPHMQSHLSQNDGETPFPSVFLQVIDELEKRLESKIAECFGWKQGCQRYT